MRAIDADWGFVGEQFHLASFPIDTKTRLTSLGLGLGAFALPKTILSFGLPYPYQAQLRAYYNFSLYQTTNAPTIHFHSR